MTKLEIIKIIKEVKELYKSYKDGGLSFIQHLANKLINTVDDDKNEVIHFFLDEIKNNENGLANVGLLTIVEMGASEYAPYIKRIYEEMAQQKDENWKYSIIEALMKLKYVEPKELYHEYVTSFLRRNQDSAFFLLVQYCNVDPDSAIPLLAEFYIKYIFRDNQMQSFLENRINYLVAYFLENPIDYLPELIRQITVMDKNVGLYLKRLIIEHLSYKITCIVPNKLIKDRIESLKKLEV
jgi:hypothetical protein